MDLPAGFFAERCALFSTSQDLVIHWLYSRASSYTKWRRAQISVLLLLYSNLQHRNCAKSSHRPLLFKINEKGIDNIRNNWQCQIWWLVSMSHKWLRKFAPPWQNIHRWWLYLNKSPRVGAGLVWFGSSSFDLDLGERNANQVVAGFL